MPRGRRPAPGFCIFAHFCDEAVRPVDHFAAFCQSLTQSEDRWEGQPLRMVSRFLGESALGTAQFFSPS
jgi:hypothetical protein